MEVLARTWSPGWAQRLTKFLAGAGNLGGRRAHVGALQGPSDNWGRVFLSGVPRETLPCPAHKAESLETLYLLRGNMCGMPLGWIEPSFIKMGILAVGRGLRWWDWTQFPKISWGVDRWSCFLRFLAFFKPTFSSFAPTPHFPLK